MRAKPHFKPVPISSQQEKIFTVSDALGYLNTTVEIIDMLFEEAMKSPQTACDRLREITEFAFKNAGEDADEVRPTMKENPNPARGFNPTQQVKIFDMSDAQRYANLLDEASYMLFERVMEKPFIRNGQTTCDLQTVCDRQTPCERLRDITDLAIKNLGDEFP